MRLTFLLVVFLIVTAVFAKVEPDDDDEEYGTVEVQRQRHASQDTEERKTPRNPCNVKDCKRGETCVLDDNKEALCVCQTCENVGENDVKVCSRHNVTYASECHLDRDHCMCRNKQPDCAMPGKKHIRLDYYDACKELTECPDNEMENFPARMRDWLFRVMTTLAYRHELEDYKELTEKAMNDNTHADAVIWKFCDLDKDPEDRHVTRRELMYIIASVKPMEHCLVPFLNKCDADDDNTITLIEWGSCLNIGHEAIVDKCLHKRSD